MMPMHFYFSDKVTLLFEFWDVSNVSGMALSLLVVLLMAVLYEVIKVGKAVFHHDMRSLKMSASWEAVGESETSSLDSETSHHAPINSAPSSHLPVIPESSLQTPARKR
ncbi:probable low affinity copper uptake protein 2 [Protopterus annectens]|uniref:probable low affinity copper uptake protein 2 n=1 Tax=Protopterus annectens TaxID=7888 RepID=UPI001CFBA724|nr:probable low affinity copper uptake protein 2 [Protopterus annectens]